MLLTLENIQNQQFNQRFRGYDMAEVDAFLDKIAETYLFLSTENSKIKEELTTLKNAQNQSLEEEQSFKNAIISAQSFADDIKQKAESHAARLQEDAKAKSTAILEATQSELQALQNEINVLSGEKERIKDELRSFLTSYLTEIDEDTRPTPQAAPPVDTVKMDQTPELADLVEPKLELEPQAVEQNGEHIDQVDDVAILYEKIDLDDDFALAELDEGADSEPPLELEKSSAEFDFSTDELDDLDMPDLDGDMLYSLEDPLDNQGPAVVIDPLDDQEK